MDQGHSATTDAFTCQYCGRAVRVRARGTVGGLRCGACGGQHAPRTLVTGGDCSRIDVESGEQTVFGPNYAFH